MIPGLTLMFRLTNGLGVDSLTSRPTALSISISKTIPPVCCSYATTDLTTETGKDLISLAPFASASTVEAGCKFRDPQDLMSDDGFDRIETKLKEV